MLLCSTGTLRRSGLIAQLEEALAGRLVASYEHIQPHVPETQVAEALALAEAHQIDAVIGFGGGSAIGLAKAISHTLEKKNGSAQESGVTPIQQPLIPVIAIPTTYAGSEITPSMASPARLREKPARSP